MNNGSKMGIQLVNGKFKPKFNWFSIVIIIIMDLLFLACIVWFCYELFAKDELNLGLLSTIGMGIFSLGYIMLISPYQQNPNNYYIKFQNENTLAGFELFYKNKPVRVLYKVDINGKIAFASNDSKLSCLFYMDGSKMSNFTKYRIINYFSKWLAENDLLSDEVTATFEDL